MRTIAICNLKGGVGKTTTAVNLAAILAAERKKRVLVVDADSQANATSFLGGNKRMFGMYHLLKTGEFTLQHTNIELVALISGEARLMDLDLTKAGSGELNLKCLCELRRLLEISPSVKEIYGQRFDYCLIDCPPAFNAASSAALIAADEVIIPTKLDAFALEGMANLLQQIQNMRRLNPGLRVLGVLPTMWYKSEESTNAERTLQEAGIPVLTKIRRSDRVDAMTYRQAPLISCSPKSGPCKDYRVLANWLDLGPGREEVQRNGE